LRPNQKGDMPMSHVPHELAEEFPEHTETMHRLKQDNAHFAKLFDEPITRSIGPFIAPKRMLSQPTISHGDHA
jgi:hypothetical protein